MKNKSEIAKDSKGGNCPDSKTTNQNPDSENNDSDEKEPGSAIDKNRLKKNPWISENMDWGLHLA